MIWKCSSGVLHLKGQLVQAPGMVVQVVSHEGLHKVVAMVIAVMLAQAQGLAHLLAGSL